MISAPYERAKAAYDAAGEALFRALPDGWSEPRTTAGWKLVTSSGAAVLTVAVDDRRDHLGTLRIRVTGPKPREMMVVSPAATVERDLVAAFRWAMDNLEVSNG